MSSDVNCASLHYGHYTARTYELSYQRFKNSRDVSVTKKRRENNMFCHGFMRKQAKELATGASEFINFMQGK